MADHTHLIALITGLANEREHLANARTDQERALRAVWVAQREREIAAEEAFLGIAPADCDLTDLDLLAELLA